MLPQPRRRFLLTVLAQVRRSWPADPEGAEDTRVVDRCLIFSPAPLTLQCQDDVFKKLDEQFEIVSDRRGA
jgi:hypothetical protein